VRLSTGSTFQRINLDLIRNFMIAYPVDETEQNKITENVQKIDNLIGSHKIYRDILIPLKRGLMQNLLTGKIRVKL
jgi:type I restriction enzyme S subunit